jgi:hypothetical protein
MAVKFHDAVCTVEWADLQTSEEGGRGMEPVVGENERGKTRPKLIAVYALNLVSLVFNCGNLFIASTSVPQSHMDSIQPEIKLSLSVNVYRQISIIRIL